MDREDEIKSKFQDSKIMKKNQFFVSYKEDIMRDKKTKRKTPMFGRFGV